MSAGVNTSYIGQIERGEKNPTIRILEKISSALGISLLDLLSSYELGRERKDQVCRHQRPLTFLTHEEIKQCLLEVLKDNTNIVINHQGNHMEACTNTHIEKGNYLECPNKNSATQLKDQRKNHS
ncbi:helix-turn-helix domain-containing protein [Brevibacillus parabrevis]|uniref:helix-turn-helix domain-containing protein n=1 Tax=Brevibacillus parabrevis TaxID=54914 RepID=UPI0036F25703